MHPIELLLKIIILLLNFHKISTKYYTANHHHHHQQQHHNLNHDYFGNSLDRDSKNDLFVFSTKRLPSKLTSMPVLSNGHIGFTIFSDSIYMNGFYNGQNGLSHRARIPNYSNIQLKECARSFDDDDVDDDNENNRASDNCYYSLNTKLGFFKVEYNSHNSGYTVLQYIYTHRYYNRAIVNHVIIRRNNYKGNITIKLIHNPGNESSKDLRFQQTTTGRKYLNEIYQKCGQTLDTEDKVYQKKLMKICFLWNHVPEEITLDSRKNLIAYKFVMTIDGTLRNAKQEMIDVLKIDSNTLLSTHTSQWKTFWKSFDIRFIGNRNLTRVTHASIFALASALPSLNSSIQNNKFYGLSPTGLGRGGYNLEDYEGHSMWDTEIWMFPSIVLMNTEWARLLLQYRYTNLDISKEYALKSGYQGARFPWESAYTGWDVTQPCCPQVAKNQVHITGDISFAIQLYLSVTNDVGWMKNEGCQMSYEIAKFWESRVKFNNKTKKYDIIDVMGPDEDHDYVTNNAFTNVIASYALKFGDFVSCLCDQPYNDWKSIANKIEILYDRENDYHPQYQNYKKGTLIKQADTILLGYPLNYHMERSTKYNDLLTYSNVTRFDGPAMTWSMYSINYHDLNMPNIAYKYFNLAYQPYMLEPFYVWNEVSNINLLSASNFITGAGGFLQSIINGYGAVRYNLKNLTIKNPTHPPDCDSIYLSGIKYRGLIFDLIVNGRNKIIKIIEIPMAFTFNIDRQARKIYSTPKEFYFQNEVIISLYSDPFSSNYDNL